MLTAKSRPPRKIVVPFPPRHLKMPLSGTLPRYSRELGHKGRGLHTR